MGSFGPIEAYAVARKNGATKAEALFLASVFRSESGGNPAAVNPQGIDANGGPGPYHATGLFQVIPFPDRVATYGDLTDPNNNAKAAIAILRSRQGQGAWAGARNSSDLATAQHFSDSFDTLNAWDAALNSLDLGPKATDIAGNSPKLDPLEAVKAIGSFLLSVGPWLAKPHNVWRLVEGFLGTVALLIGLSQLGALPAKAAPLAAKARDGMFKGLSTAEVV